MKNNFDEILRHLGEFGRYQKWVYFLLCLPVITHAFRMMINVYLLNVPAHRCSLPDYPNDTYSIQSPHHAHLINDSIPYETRDGKVQYDQCHVYSSSNSSDDWNRTKRSCDRWVYDKSAFQSTAATEMNMVCAASLEAPNAQVIFMGGYLVGSTLFGAIGDNGISLSWASNYATFVILRFINGACTAGVQTTGFVIAMELVGPKKRVIANAIHGVFYSIGYTTLTGIAYLVRDWHTLELITAAPVCVFLIYWWILPESARWLLSESRTSEAKEIILYAAKVNKVTITDDIVNFDKYEEMHASTDITRVSIRQIFKSRVLCTRTMVTFFTWLVVSLVYFGLSSNTDNLGAGSLHINTFLSSLTEYPATLLCLFLLDRIGRKKLLCAFMTIGGVACVLTVATIFGLSQTQQWATVALSMVGKLCISGSFGVIYIYTSELYPTHVRNLILGLNSSMARVGGMLAPYFLDWGLMIGGENGRAFPLVVFGGLSILVGIIDMSLPETLNQDLPETIEDAINLGNRKTSTNRIKLYKDSDIKLYEEEEDYSKDGYDATQHLINR